MPMTDTERLNFLQYLTNISEEPVILRFSISGRGWRLHQTTRKGAVMNVREAIDKFVMEYYPQRYVGMPEE